MSFLDRVTPLLITLDEAPNLGRTLAALEWAREIVVVDSGSTDDTLAILRDLPRARVLHRDFDSFAAQWRFGLERGGIGTDWIAALDADHVLTPGLVRELETLAPPPEVNGLVAGFTYCIGGRPLRGSLYPPRIVFFRRDSGRFVDDGHTQRVEVEGEVGRLAGRILHDDRKDLSRWLAAQARYSRAEARKLTATDSADLSMQDRLRRLIVPAPFAAFLYCLFVRGCILDGWAGWRYAFERMAAEVILSMRLIEAKLRPGGKADASRRTR